MRVNTVWPPVRTGIIQRLQQRRETLPQRALCGWYGWPGSDRPVNLQVRQYRPWVPQEYHEPHMQQWGFQTVEQSHIKLDCSIVEANCWHKPIPSLPRRLYCKSSLTFSIGWLEVMQCEFDIGVLQSTCLNWLTLDREGQWSPTIEHCLIRQSLMYG